MATYEKCGEEGTPDRPVLAYAEHMPHLAPTNEILLGPTRYFHAKHVPRTHKWERLPEEDPPGS